MRDPKSAMRVYRLDEMTVLEVNDVTGTIDKIKVGMQVRDCVERDFDTLDKLSVGTADPPPVTAKT